MAVDTGKTVEMIFDKAYDTFEDQDTMLPMVTVTEYDPGDLQDSGNVVWKQVKQQRAIQEGWDMTGKKTGIIQETYPCVLGEPQNDVVQLRADDKRHSKFWEDSAEQGAIQQGVVLNSAIAQTVVDQGSLYYRSDDTSGWDFVTEADVIMTERQNMERMKYFLMNPRDERKFGKDLTARQTIDGRVEKTWKTGQLDNIAGFDVFRASFLPSLTGGAAISTTVTGNHSFKPEAGTVNATTKVVTNIDYREAVLTVAASASYSVGDKFTISNSAVTIKSLGKSSKTNTGQAMTFTVISKPSSTSLQIFPKPIALDDSALTTLEKAFANVDTTILNAATIDRINSDATAQSNIFFTKPSIEVMGGKIPAELFKTFGGKSVKSMTLSNGLEMYMLHDGNITEMTFEYRIFVWYGITNVDPQSNGVAITY